MRTQDDTQRRLTPEDIEALRGRFEEFDGDLPDVRAHGAVTIGDMAEAFGVPPHEVAQVLDRYRAERALEEPPARGLDQRGLLALALILLLGAFGIYRYGPHKLSDDEVTAEMEQKIAEAQAQRKRHPVVHYPITTEVKTGAMPPYGFDVTFRGRLTVTKAARLEGGPIGKEAATAALAEALANVYEVARKSETGAPEPAKPLPKREYRGWGYDDVPGTLAYVIGSTNSQAVGCFNLDPSAPAPSNRPSGIGTPPTRASFRGVAASITDAAARSQDETLKSPKTPGGYQAVPAGFRVDVNGRSRSATMGSRLTVLPFDAVRVERRLKEVIENMLLHDIDPDAARFYGLVTTQPKAPNPATVQVTITGPLRVVEMKLPQQASAEYPTAADAVRASERIVARGVHEAALQIAELNQKAGVKP